MLGLAWLLHYYILLTRFFEVLNDKVFNTPVLVTHFSKGPGPWKIPSQGVQGRSRDFRNVNNEIVGLAVFEIWNMVYLVRVLGDPPENFEIPKKM